MNSQDNQWFQAICSDNFDPGKAISDLTGHQPSEIEKPVFNEFAEHFEDGDKAIKLWNGMNLTSNK